MPQECNLFVPCRRRDGEEFGIVSVLTLRTAPQELDWAGTSEAPRHSGRFQRFVMNVITVINS